MLFLEKIVLLFTGITEGDDIMAIKGLYNADGTTTYSVSDVKLLHNKFIMGKVI